jgi:hypothetical protein
MVAVLNHRVQADPLHLSQRINIGKGSVGFTICDNALCQRRANAREGN